MVLTTKPDALLGLMDDKPHGSEPLYQEKYIRPVRSAATSGTVTIEISDGKSAMTRFPVDDPEPHPRAGEREALRRHRADRKAKAKATRKARRRNRLRRR